MARHLIGRGNRLTLAAHRNRVQAADLVATDARRAADAAAVAAAGDIAFVCVTGSQRLEAAARRHAQRSVRPATGARANPACRVTPT